MKIAVINTGGTISCVGNPLAPMSAAAFAAACTQIINPIIKQQYPGVVIEYLTNVQFPESTNGTLDSTNLQPTDWCIMAAAILNSYSQYDGWIILHGTDTMDFTGTAIPFLLSAFSATGIPTAVLSKPIIITGSQVPLFYKVNSQLTLNYNTDAFQNVCGAVAIAQSGIPEVCVYFQNHLYRGNRSVKTNASEFNAFSSPNYPALAQFGVALTVNWENVLPGPVSAAVSLDNPTVLNAVIAQLNYIRGNINSWPVMQFNAFPAGYTMNPAGGVIANLIKASVGQGIKGLILESYGEGNFPSGNPDKPELGAIYQALLDANANKSVVIVDCTQVLSGVVNNSAYAAGAWLPSVGALSPADMTPMAAFAKLMILLTAAGYAANKWTPAQVKALLQLNLLGEMRSVSRLDSRINSTLLANESISTLDGSATLVNDPVLGPVLTQKGTQVWAAIKSPPASKMPGRLIMQNDGNLAFYSRYNEPMWATNTGIASGASSVLILAGPETGVQLSLTVYNYSANTVSATLYKS